MQRIVIAILMIVLCGCARPTITYREYMLNSMPPENAHIRIIVFRPKDSFDAQMLGGGRSVRVKVDDQVAGYVRGGFKIFDLPAGKHTISVDLWDRPGQCELELAATAGSEYYFQIGPMRSFASATLEQAVVGAAASSVGLVPALAGAAVLGAVSRPRACDGDFFIEAIENEVATSRFADLKKN